MPKAAAKPAPDPLVGQIDELGALEKELAPFKAKIARVEALRKTLRAAFADIAPLVTFEKRGGKFGLAVGACASERHINEAHLIRLIGLKKYATIASVTLGALEEHVGADIQSAVVSSAATGSRRLNTFELAAH